MSVIARAITNVTARRSADLTGWGPYADGTIPPNSAILDAAGLPVDEHTVRHLIDAYACISLISDSISMLPFRGYRRDGDFRRPIEGTTFYDKPDPELERGEFMAQVVDSLAVRGNAFLPFLEVDSRGYPKATRVIHPDDVRPQKNAKGELVYELRNGTTFHHRAMLHIRLRPVAGQIMGLSPIDCARRGIRMAVRTQDFGERWFAEGAAPSSVLESDDAIDDDEARRIQAKWVASHGGRRRPAVLAGGLKWKAVTITPEESQFLETRKLNTAETARIWRVPPHMIGDVERTTSWGSGIEEMGIGFVVYTTGIYFDRIEAAFSSPKVSPKGQFAKFTVGALLRGDAKARFESYALGRQWGWLSVNDIRALEDLPPVDGGDVYLQPMNMVDVEQALAALKLKGAAA